jgi:hypothetical protein
MFGAGVWSRALPNASVMALKTGGLSGDLEEGLRAYYALDDGDEGNRVLDTVSAETAPLAGDAQLVADPTRPLCPD